MKKGTKVKVLHYSVEPHQQGKVKKVDGDLITVTINKRDLVLERNRVLKIISTETYKAPAPFINDALEWVATHIKWHGQTHVQWVNNQHLSVVLYDQCDFVLAKMKFSNARGKEKVTFTLVERA